MQTKKYTAAEQAENISKLIAILHTFTPDQMTDFVTGAQDLIERLQAEDSLAKRNNFLYILRQTRY